MFRKKTLFYILALALFSASGCKQVVIEEEQLIDGLELVYAISTEDGVTVGGLYGSVPPRATISISSLAGDELSSLKADDKGRFIADIPMFTNPEIRIQINTDAPVNFRVRDVSTAIAEAVRPSASGVGYVPNDLLVVEDNQQLFAFVVRSGDNAVSKINLD